MAFLCAAIWAKVINDLSELQLKNSSIYSLSPSSGIISKLSS